MKRIVLTGATGLIGSALYPELRKQGYAVTVLARNVEKAAGLYPDAERVLLWAPGVDGAWKAAIDGAHAVIHLAGESLAGERWTETYKKRLRDSRVLGTRDMVEGIAAATRPPALLISASAVGYYGDTGEDDVDERTPAGSDFLAQLCVEWEAEALKARGFGVRVVLPRTGLVLSDRGGSLPRLMTPFKMFAGGPVGSGRQWFPWIHIDDVVGLYLHALEHADVDGVLNAVAPQQLRNKEFAAALGDALKRPARIAVPGFVVRLAVGELGDALLGGQRVHPSQALSTGYSFAYPDIASALVDLVRN